MRPLSHTAQTVNGIVKNATGDGSKGMQDFFLWEVEACYEFLVEILTLEYLTIFLNSITEMKSFSKNSELFSVQILATAVISKLSSEFRYFW